LLLKYWNFVNYQSGYGKEFRITLKEEKDVDLIGLAQNPELEQTDKVLVCKCCLVYLFVNVIVG
jgi:hypothetical protein